ncbi:MAG: orotidine-5'-phosphate decarboxylase [Dehalococcoidia bacterium]|nr:orotidine-5'-phosphate decarboxylase [Dehalococcoidia bacterium]
MSFFSQLNEAIKSNHSLLCVGLDPDPTLMPTGIGILDFNKSIIDATKDLVCAYKPNLAFYEAEGARGWEALKHTIAYIPKHIPVIADAKRGDIGNTARAYAKAVFEELGAGAVTVNPYLGFDTIEPFLDYGDKGVFILCRTSNKGSADFQSLTVEFNGRQMPLYQAVAERADKENRNGNIGMVIGATCPEELNAMRQAHPDLPFLIPGVGAQGGDLRLAVEYGADQRGAGIIINSSRQILYASRGADFAQAARSAALELRDAINACRRI